MLFIKDLPPVSDHVAQGHPAADLLRRGTRTTTRSWARASGSSTTRPGEQNVYASYAGAGRRARRRRAAAARCFATASAPRRSSSPATSRDTSRVLYYRNIADRASQGAAVPAVRPRSVPGGRRRRHAEVDPRRLHGHRSLSVCRAHRDGTSYMRNSVKVVIDAYDGIAEGLRQRAARSADPHLGRDLPRHLPAARQHAGRPARPPARARRAVPHPDRLYTTYHMDAPDRLLPSRRPVADPVGRTSAAARCRSCGTS